MKLSEFKAANPAYENVPDDVLADALHAKFYSEIPKSDFYSQIGFAAKVAEPVNNPPPKPTPIPEEKKTREQKIAEMDAATDPMNPGYMPVTESGVSAVQTVGRGQMDAKRSKYEGRVLDADIPPVTAGSLAQDFASGAIQIPLVFGKGVGEAARLLSGDTIGKGLTDATDKGIRAVQNTVGSNRGQAQRTRFQQDVEDKNLTAADVIAANPGALADEMLPQVGSMVLPIGAAGLAGKAATSSRAAILASAIDEATVLQRANRARELAATGATVVQNAANTYSELRDKGADQASSYGGAAITVPATVAAGFLTGGGAEAQAAKMLAGQKTKSGALSVLKAGAKEGAQEVGGESGQYAGELYGLDASFDPDKAAKRGAIAFTMGAAMGSGVNLTGQARGALIDRQQKSAQKIADAVAAAEIAAAQRVAAIDSIGQAQTVDEAIASSQVALSIPEESTQAITQRILEVERLQAQADPSLQEQPLNTQDAVAAPVTIDGETSLPQGAIEGQAQVGLPVNDNAGAVNAPEIASVLESSNQAPGALQQEADLSNAQANAAPVVLQNRNRSTPASIAQMQSIAKAPDYGRLGFSRDFANGAPVVAGTIYTVPNKHRGRKDIAVASDGTKIPIQYAVVDAGRVLASNKADGSSNAEYGSDKNAIRAIAGNGRIAGLQSAYANNTAAQYVSDLSKDMELHGIPPAAIEGIKRPVLVRLMNNADITPNIGDLSNTQNNLQLSAVEQENNDAGRVDLGSLTFSNDGAVTPEAIRQFVQAMPPSERGGLIDTNGQPSRQAADRIQAAVFAKAYGNDGLVRLFAQAQDPEARLIMSALARVAPKMARLDGAGALDIRGIVSQAAEIAVNARRSGTSLAMAAQQVDMMSDPDVGLILNLFAENPRSNAKVIEALSNAADFAYRESSKAEVDMFGAVDKATREDVLRGLDNEQRSAGNLENAQGGKPVQGDVGGRDVNGRAGANAATAEEGRPAQGQPADQVIEDLFPAPSTSADVGNPAQSQAGDRAVDQNAKARPDQGTNKASQGQKFQSIQNVVNLNSGLAGLVEPRPIATSNVLHYETNTDGIDDLLRLDGQADVAGFVVSEKPSASNAQSDSRRVDVVFRPDSLSGQELKAKGRAEAVGREYQTDLVAPRAIQAITMSAADAAKLRGLTRRRLEDFEKEVLPGGLVRFHRKGLPRYAPSQEPQKNYSRAARAPAISTVLQIRNAISRAYGNGLISKLESKGLVTIAENEIEAVALAALARAEKLGGDAEKIKRQMMASVMAQRAYHGTPYRGIQKFSTENIGTGEGAQAYGWGLYFASKKDIAEYYRTGLSYREMARSIIDQLPYDADFQDTLNAAKDMSQNHAAFIRELAADDWLGFDYPAQAITAAFKEIDAYDASPQLRKAVSEAQGQLYEVEIPEDSDMLLWDRPMSEQPDAVLRAIESVMADFYGADYKMAGSVAQTLKGRGVVEWLGKTQEGSRKLAEVGIKGIKYLDGSSRAAGDGTYNYVIFDDADVQIVDVKYSALGAVEGFFDNKTGKSFLIASNLTEQSAPGTLMHEVGIHMAASGKLEPLFKRATNLLKIGKNNEFIKRVQKRLDSAGETSSEEAAAYIVTEYENNRVNAPASVVSWINDLMASVRAWFFRNGIVIKADQLTIADIAAVARANARSIADNGLQQNEVGANKDSAMYSRDESSTLPTTITIDGQERPTTNSKGQSIASTREGVENFYRWFGDSKVVDEEGRPAVVYHDGRPDFTGIKGDGRFGSAIFVKENSPAGYSDNTYELYLRGEVLELDQLNDELQTEEGREALAKALRLDVTEDVIDLVADALTDGSNYPDDPAVWDAIRAIDEADAQSEIQKLRGKLAKSFGYQSVRTPDEFDGETLMVVDPMAIKSATGNASTFDPSNPDIRFSRRSPSAVAAAGATPNWRIKKDGRIDRLIYEFQDSRIDLKRTQEAIVTHGRAIEEKFDARLAETLNTSRIAYRKQTFEEIEVDPLLAAMAVNRVSMNELADYLHARGAKDRNAQTAKVNPSLPDGGAGKNTQGVLMTNQAAQDYLDNIPANRQQKLDFLAAKVDAITKGTRQLLVTEGLEKPEAIKAWEAAYKNYVPMFRDEAESGNPHPSGGGFSVRGSSSQRVTGSTKEVTNILAHVIMQREAAISKAEKNRVALSLYGLALTNPNLDVWATIRPDMQAATIAANLQAMGVNPLVAEAGMQGVPTVRTVDPILNKVVDRPNPMYKSLPGAIVVKIGGEDRVLMLNQDNPRALRMAENLKNMDGLTRIDLASSIVGKSTRWMAAVNTQYNPAFGVLNGIRDTWGAFFNLSSTYLRGKSSKVIFNAFVHAGPAIAQELLSPGGNGKWAKLYRQFQEDGGKMGFSEIFKDANDRQKNLDSKLKLLQQGKFTTRKALSVIGKLLEGFNTTIENAVRLSAYSAALDANPSRPQAARLARELTVDFNRKGRAGRELGPLYAFFNASLQGGARTVETLRGPAGVRIITGGLVLGALQPLLLAMAGLDDDEIPDSVKTRAYIIPLFNKDKGYVAVPMSLGLHVIPTVGRVISELALNGGKDVRRRTFNAIGEVAGAFNPLGGGNVFTADGALKTIAPTILDPIVEIGFNKNFAGSNIELDVRGETDVRPGFARARESTQRSLTGQQYLWFSKALNTMSLGSDYEAGFVSPTPERLQYLAQVAGGGVLRELEKSINLVSASMNDDEIKPNKIPLLGRLFGEVDEDAVSKSRYYESSKRLNKIQGALSAAQKAGDADAMQKIMDKDPEFALYDFKDDVSKQISKLNKLAVTTINDREQLKRIDEIRVQYMKQLNEAVRLKELEAKGATSREQLRQYFGSE